MLVTTKNGAAKLFDVSKAQQNVNTKRYLSKLGEVEIQERWRLCDL